MPIFNPSNYPLVTPVSEDTVLVRQASSGRIKSALVSALSQAATPIQLAATVADLKAIPTDGIDDGALAFLAGYYESGDGGAGQFYYDVTSAAGDNGGTIIAPDDGVGRWIRVTEDGILPAKSFGVIGDGVSNDTAALQLALNAAATDGLTVSIAGLRIRTTDVNVPEGVTLIGGINYPDPRDATLLTTLANTILLAGAAATVSLNETSSVQGFKILPYGMDFPQDAADVATWVGTAITINAGAHGALIANMAVVGFARAVDMENSAFTEQTRLYNVAIDCVAGVRILSGTDRVYLSQVECWPTASIGLSSPVNADLQRSGIAFEFDASSFGIDAPFLSSCFSYGYATGFKLTSVNGAVLMNCVVDYTTSKTATILGFDVSGDTSVTTLIGCKVYRSTTGLKFNPNQSVHALMVSSSSFEFCDTNGILLNNGNGSIIGSFFSNLTASTTNGINAANCGGSCRFFVDNNVFNYTTNAVAITGTSPGDVIVWGKNVVTGNGTNLIIGTGINTYASAATLLIPAAEDTFFVSGVDGITAISTAVAYQGRKITLIFTAALTITHSANLRLAGAANWTTQANDNITFVYDGSSWREVARCEV